MSEAAPKRTAKSTFTRFYNTQKREAKHVIAELLAVRGLMPLLMKPRNGDRWTPAERTELLNQLRRLSRLSPYLLFLLVPGSALLLPAYAWWLDRRRDLRPSESRAALPDSQSP